MYSPICSNASRAGSLRPQSASEVPIDLASSKPGMSWQPEQPYLEIERRPTYFNSRDGLLRGGLLDFVVTEQHCFIPFHAAGARKRNTFFDILFGFLSREFFFHVLVRKIRKRLALGCRQFLGRGDVGRLPILRRFHQKRGDIGDRVARLPIASFTGVSSVLGITVRTW